MRLIHLVCMVLFCTIVSAQNSVHFSTTIPANSDFNEVKTADFEIFNEADNSIKNGSYWFKIQVKDKVDNVLYIPTSKLNGLKLYSASGKRIEEISYSRYPSFLLDKFEEYPLYLNVNFVKEASIPIQITSQESFAKAHQQVLFKLGIYFGFALMVIIINFMCFFLFDEKVFLYYCAVLITLTACFFYSDGLFRLFALDSAFVLTYLEPLLHITLAVFSAYFATKFLKLNETLPKLQFVTFGLLTLAISSFITYWATSNWVFSAIAYTITWAVLLNYLIAGAMLFRKKVYARFYVIAHSVLFVMMVDFYVLSGFGMAVLNVDTFQLKIAGVIEMLVLTYAIMYRMRVIKEENEVMQIEMRLYLKRIELLRGSGNVQIADDMYLENLVNLHDLDNLETKILNLISRGKDNAKIAAKLDISLKEVEKITKSLYNKLDISEQIQDDHNMMDQQPDYIYN